MSKVYNFSVNKEYKIYRRNQQVTDLLSPKAVERHPELGVGEYETLRPPFLVPNLVDLAD